MAVSGRPLGVIWAGYLFAPNIKAATWQNGWGAQRFDRDQRRSYGASDNWIMDRQPRYLFADIFLVSRMAMQGTQLAMANSNNQGNKRGANKTKRPHRRTNSGLHGGKPRSNRRSETNGDGISWLADELG